MGREAWGGEGGRGKGAGAGLGFSPKRCCRGPSLVLGWGVMPSSLLTFTMKPLTCAAVQDAGTMPRGPVASTVSTR